MERCCRPIIAQDQFSAIFCKIVKIASAIRSSGHLQGRQTCQGGGKNGYRTAHSASVHARSAKPSQHGHNAPEWRRTTSLNAASLL